MQQKQSLTLQSWMRRPASRQTSLDNDCSTAVKDSTGCQTSDLSTNADEWTDWWRRTDGR